MSNTEVRKGSREYLQRERNLVHDPAEMDQIYAAVCKGTCMEPEIEDGTCMVFARDGEPVPGEFVGIWLRPEAMWPGQPQQLLKRLVMGPWPGVTFPFRLAPESNARPMIVVEQLNPPRDYVIPCTDILALHRCLGRAELLPNGMARIARGLAEQVAA